MKNTVIYADSDGIVEDAIKWAKDNGHTAQTVKILRRGESCVVVLR